MKENMCMLLKMGLILFQSNIKIIVLNVFNNDFGSKGVIYLVEVIVENIFINKLVKFLKLINC